MGASLKNIHKIIKQTAPPLNLVAQALRIRVAKTKISEQGGITDGGTRRIKFPV